MSAARASRVLRLSSLLVLLAGVMMLVMLIWNRALTTLPQLGATAGLRSDNVLWAVQAPAGSRRSTSTSSTHAANATVSPEYERQQLELAVQLLQRRAAQLEREGYVEEAAAFTGRAVPEEATRRFLLLSSWRSGSSFVGDLLASQPLAFYLFEPLKWSASGGAEVPGERRAQLLSDALGCRFGAISDFEALTSKGAIRSAITDSVCARLPDGCRRRELLEKICALHPVRVVKTVRARVRYVAPLVRASPRLKLVLLVRDPRAVVHSRRKNADWCRHKCGSMLMLCQWLSQAVREAAELERQLPGRVVTARYEHLTTDPAAGARELFAALGTPLTTSTVQFLLQHTGQPRRVAADLLGDLAPPSPLSKSISKTRLAKEKSNPFSTYRNSTAAAQDWRRTMQYKRMTAVQTQCTEALQLMGYRQFRSQTEFRNLSLPLETTA